MKISARRLPFVLAFAGLLALATAPGFAADAPPVPEAPEVATAPVGADQPLDGAISQYGGLEDERGDCKLYCGFDLQGNQVWYYNVTRGQCCGGQLSCPDGSPPSAFIFYPYQGFAEFCST